MKFVAMAGLDGTEVACYAWRRYQSRKEGVIAPHAPNHEVFIKRRFHGSRIGNAEHGIRRFEVIGNSKASLALPGTGETIINIAANSKVE